MLLNDTQKENEDYILEKSGEKGNILIATNAAGRGTDIILTEESKKLGGLLVIFGFFPENSRIENQGIGRAGRQGNPGMNKIVFSKDELFINILNNNIKNDDNIIENYYYLRNEYIKKISELRMSGVKNERRYYYSLKLFFSFKAFLDKILKEEYFLNKLERKNIYDINLNYYMRNVIIFVEDSWSEFYSEISNDRYDEGIENNIPNYFNEYLFILVEKWSKHCIQFYRTKIEVYKEDIFLDILSKIIDKWIDKEVDFEKFIQNFEI